MKHINFLLFIITLFTFNAGLSQSGIQNVKGIIVDKQSEMPLIGATIQLIFEAEKANAITDIDGRFRIEGVPLGRQAFKINYLGYEELILPNVEIGAGKEVFLNIEMEESFLEIDAVVITANSSKDRSINDMATVSTRQFSMEEVNRYSGGRSDVGRLAGNFAGVSTADDSRNDIVIRGNSPTGLLWQLEGIPIPSPNHFSTVGTTGGPVSALNTNFIKNSDFMTSAFPAEYGNAISGVFDIGFRNGNKDETEFTLQVGAVTGIEGMIEGPISKENNSSYIVGYRYSFLGIAQSIGLDIGTNATPNYSDISFKVDLGKSRLGNFSLFGIYGTSDIEFLHYEVDETDLFAADDEDSGADSQFGVIGLKHNFLIDDKSYLRTIVGYSGNQVVFSRDRYYNQDAADEVVSPFVRADDGLRRISFTSFYNKKYNKRFTARIGVLAESINVLLDQKSAEFGIDQNMDGIFDLVQVYQFDERTLTLQPFIQTQYRLSEQWTINTGVRALYYDLNKELSIEPRAAINWQPHDQHRFNLGYGLHAQSQPLPLQLATKEVQGEITTPNKELGFTKSNQFVIGYDYKINSSWRSKIEAYYQGINNVPIDKNSSTFSMLNVGADFGFPIDKNDLINGGTGRNMGIEATLEKFFNKGYYLLGTASIFDSKYQASDGIERNTAFNNQYVLNVLTGKEFAWGGSKQHRFTIDTKITTAGGRYYTPVDLEASRVNEIEVLDQDAAYSQQQEAYFRWDIKFGIKLNSTKRKFSQAFFFDIQNVTNNQNIFSKSYNRATNQVNDIYQIGFFPNFMYKLEF